MLLSAFWGVGGDLTRGANFKHFKCDLREGGWGHSIQNEIKRSILSSVQKGNN